MSRFRTSDNYISQKGFAHLPKVGDVIPGESQPEGSLESGSTSGRVSGTSGQHDSQLQEGDLVTGTVDIAHERVRMVPTILGENHTEEKNAMEEYFISLKIIPLAYRKGWTLNHDSNTTWLSPPFYEHHDTYATILIAPSAEDSARICDRLERDNARREQTIKAGGVDPGRDEDADWFEGIDGEYELVIVRPAHFMIGNFPVVIKHPVTQNFTSFYASEYKDGFLREGSSTGPPLPPFRSRGEIDRSVPLNPILVNFAAMLRLRRLIRQDLTWGSMLDRRVIDVLQRVVSLHAAVLWNPQRSQEAQLTIEIPSSQPPLFRDLRGWPYDRAPSLDPQPNPSPPSTILDRYFALVETEFKELPDLGGGGNSPSLS